MSDDLSGPGAPSYTDRGCTTDFDPHESDLVAVAQPPAVCSGVGDRLTALAAPLDDDPTDPRPDPEPPGGEPLPRWSVQDVTLATGVCLIGGVVEWTTTNGVEHIAGVDRNHHVIVFWRHQAAAWHTVDVTAITGVEVVSDLEAWQTGASPQVEHLAGHSVTNELFVFWWSPAADWQAVNVTAKAGAPALGRPTAWLTANGPYTVEHLGCRTPDGDVVVFWWSPANDWQVVNVTEITGERVETDLVAWQTKNGQYNVEHLAGANAQHGVIVFWWSPAHDWQAIDVSALTGVRCRSALTAWLSTSGRFTVEHLAGASPDDELVVFWWSPAHDWQAMDATSISGMGLAGRPASYLAGLRPPELLAGRGQSGQLTSFWWQPRQDWQALDVTRIAGPRVRSDPVVWSVTRQGRSVERMAAVGVHGELLVFEGSRIERDETDAVNSPYPGVVWARRVRRRVLTILWDPDKPGVPRPDKATVEELLYGTTGSVRSYYLEVSGGQFTIENAGVLGWYESDYPPSEYWPGGGVAGRDSGAEAIRKAAADIDVAVLDRDGDGALSPDEVAVLFILPGTGSGGGLVRTVGEDYLTRAEAAGITVDGTKIGLIAEVSLGATPGIVSHELAHLLLGLGDMYFTFPNPQAAASYSLMDQHQLSPHLDPPNRLKLGWLRPRLVYRSGRYPLPAIRSSRSPIVLLDPTRGTDEYFLVENRAGPGTFDAALADEGVGVWHVIELPAAYNAAVPPGVSATDWSSVNGWSRKGIRMIRPVMPLSDGRALWDGTDPVTGYPLLPDDPDPTHAELRWGDGTPSPFSISAFGPPGPLVELTIDVGGAPAYEDIDVHRVCGRPEAPGAGRASS